MTPVQTAPWDRDYWLSFRRPSGLILLGVRRCWKHDLLPGSWPGSCSGRPHLTQMLLGRGQDKCPVRGNLKEMEA